jgi:5-methylcytosine-specific restriction enzyme B
MSIKLNSKLEAELREKWDQSQVSSKLLSKSLVQKFLNRFQKKFSPEALSSFHGEALLDAIHKHNTRDSLVYWLEYKNDEEFPTRWFGAMRGGSALKFNIFWSPETESWYKRSETGHASQKQEIGLEEAIQVAERHRSQLTDANKVFATIPDEPTQDDYDQLENKLGEIAPDIYNLAWGHKYLCILNPTKLDDFQTLDFKEHYHTRLLLSRPSVGGRYASAFPYVNLAKQFGIYCCQFTWLLSQYFGSPRQYWRIGAGVLDDPSGQWDAMHEGEFVALGWNNLKDLTDLTISEPSQETIKKVFEKHEPDLNPQRRGRWIRAFKNFLWKMKPGDIVAVSAGTRILGIGCVTDDPYVYVESDSVFAHRRPVRWLSTEQWTNKSITEQPQFPFFPINREENQIAIEQFLLQIGQDKSKSELLLTTGSKALQMKDVLSKVELKIFNLVKDKGQVILYGPPGTGKTYWALKTARASVSWKKFGKQFEELNEQEKEIILGSQDKIGLVTICTFHPSFNYEDFVEGYKPYTTENNMLSFELKSGIFKHISEIASKDKEQDFFLIIDEINRGDVPRIFGELLTLLEIDKRSSGVKLAYSSSSFSISPNIFIIGTMNTADQSIALLDTALRRRFRFIELMPDYDIFKNSAVESIRLSSILKALNERIRENLGTDGRERQIGHAYFMKNGKPIENTRIFSQVIQNEVVPLLMEYCYGDFPLLFKLLGSRLVDEKEQTIKSDLFEVSGYSELPQVLLGSTADLSNEVDDHREMEDVDDGNNILNDQEE